MKTVNASVSPLWRLFISNELTLESAASVSSFTDKVITPSGTAIDAVEIDFPSEFVDFHKALGHLVPPETSALFVGCIIAEDDGVALFGAGADWWWTCFVNGEQSFSRGREHPDGNKLSSLKKTDWIFPVKLRKGENIVVLHLVSGQFWTLSAGLMNMPAGIDFNPQENIPREMFANLSLAGNTTKDPVGYKVGEEIEFIFELFDDLGGDQGQLFLLWTSQGEDGKNLSGVSPISVSRPAYVRTSLQRPGFVHVTAKVIAPGIFESLNGEHTSFDGGAGAEIEKLTPAVSCPDDFDEYWARQRARLDEIPLEPVVEEYLGTHFHDGTKIPDSLKMFVVKIPCAGPNPVTGFLSVPKAEGKYAASVVFDGYSKEPKLSHRLMTPNTITFHINAHGYDFFRGPKYYEEFFKPFETKHPAYALSPEENANPDTSYFNGMALRVMRAMDFVKTLPQWNGRDLIARGGSQGGLQSIWAASLVPGVTKCICSINWCSNIAGLKHDDRLCGWEPEYVRGLDYYDTVFHASRIPKTCFVDVVRAGLGDYTCPPSGVTAMYNAITAPKRIAFYQNSTHMYVQFEPTISRRNAY